MATESQNLSADEHTLLERVLDTLLPPDGTFPAPSKCDVIDGFILPALAFETGAQIPYPGIDLTGLRETLAAFQRQDDIETGLRDLEQTNPAQFEALWALAVYGYYSRPEVTEAIQHDLAPGYHGAPLPVGYAHVIAPWDRSDPNQLPIAPRGSYVATDDVRRLEISDLESEAR